MLNSGIEKQVQYTLGSSTIHVTIFVGKTINFLVVSRKTIKYSIKYGILFLNFTILVP